MKLMNHVHALAVAGIMAAIGVVSPATGTAAPEKTSKKSSQKQAGTLKAVNNTTCPVMDAPIGSMGEGITVTHNGYSVKLCCASCSSKFDQNPDLYLRTALGKSASESPVSAGSSPTYSAAIEIANKQGKKKSAASKTVNNAHCPVNGGVIGSMGPGSVVTHKSYKVSLCCAGCMGKFNENPDVYLQAALSAPKRQ